MKKVGLAIGFVLLGTLVFSIPFGIFGSSNIVWGEPDQYGTVAIPGTKVLHLPAKTIDVSYAVDVIGRGNETPDLPLPKLSLSVVRVGSNADDVKFDESRGDSSNAAADGADTLRRVWKIHVPKEGDYRVVAGGDPIGGEANPHFWFGHGPPIPGAFVPLLGFITTLIVGAFLLLRRRRKSAPVAFLGDN